MSILLFEISDKVVPVSVMYTGFISCGLIGLLLGLWKWKLGLVWLVFPMCAAGLMFLWLQTGEIDYLYRHIIQEPGERYIWHSGLSPLLGVVMNVLGILGGFLSVRAKPK